MTTRHAHDSRDEFYVGYLPTPPGVLRWVRIVVPVILWVAVPVAAVIAMSMRSPGDAVWSFYEGEPPAEYTGVVHAVPYPMLRWTDDTGRIVSALLVDEGKFGAREELASMDGRPVTVEAHVLRRDGRVMLELVAGSEIKAPSTSTDATPPSVERLGSATLRGEIMDAKCFLGAMKPGEGLTHRACAQLCVSGGIPPALVTIDANGNRSYFLVTRGGAKANDLVLEHMGRPVEIRGTLGRIGAWFTIDAEQISPL